MWPILQVKQITNHHHKYKTCTHHWLHKAHSPIGELWKFTTQKAGTTYAIPNTAYSISVDAQDNICTCLIYTKMSKNELFEVSREAQTGWAPKQVIHWWQQSWQKPGLNIISDIEQRNQMFETRKPAIIIGLVCCIGHKEAFMQKWTNQSWLQHTPFLQSETVSTKMQSGETLHIFLQMGCSTNRHTWCSVCKSCNTSWGFPC